MTYDTIASGSSGNCLVLNGILALDMGVSWKKVVPYVRGLQLVFVGHAHGDHFKGPTVRRLAAERPQLRFCGEAHMVERFINAGVNPRKIDVLEPNKRYSYGPFEIEAFPLFHDAPNFGLKIWMGGESALYAVDTGHLLGVEFPGADLYLLESNHTEAEIRARAAEKLERGEYSYEKRAAATHLSYQQAMDFLAMNAAPTSRYVLLHAHQPDKKPPHKGAEV